MTTWDLEVAARTVGAEARGQSSKGQLAVALVIVRRAQIKHRSLAATCLDPKDFSCWNDGDPNWMFIADATLEMLAPFIAIVCTAVAGVMPDPTNGATHYHAKGLMPVWAKDHTPCATIGDHLFYKDIPW